MFSTRMHVYIGAGAGGGWIVLTILAVILVVWIVVALIKANRKGSASQVRSQVQQPPRQHQQGDPPLTRNGW